MAALYFKEAGIMPDGMSKGERKIRALFAVAGRPTREGLCFTADALRRIAQEQPDAFEYDEAERRLYGLLSEPPPCSRSSRFPCSASFAATRPPETGARTPAPPQLPGLDAILRLGARPQRSRSPHFPLPLGLRAAYALLYAEMVRSSRYETRDNGDGTISHIHTFSAPTPRTSHGPRAELIAFDEAAGLPPETFNSETD